VNTISKVSGGEARVAVSDDNGRGGRVEALGPCWNGSVELGDGGIAASDAYRDNEINLQRDGMSVIE
jgi:hypothetical protein